MSCSSVVRTLDDGSWHIVWHCGDVEYGVDDGDLFRARKRHVCILPETQTSEQDEIPV